GRVLACLGGGGGYTHAATGRGYTLRFHATCEFRVSRDGRVIRVHATPGTTPETVAILVGGHVTALLLTLAGECVLHASAVAVDGAAIAFVGSPGMGKSTLAARLCHPKIRGWHAEDVVQRQFQTLGRVAAVVPVYRADIPWGPAADAAAEWEGALLRLLAP